MNWKLDLVVKRPYEENDETLCFKTTPIIKVIILSIFTFGFYNLILFYNFWKSLNERFGYQVSPFWRAFFACITNFSLFPILSKYANAFKMNIFAPILLAIIYLITSYSQQIRKQSILMGDTVSALLVGIIADILFVAGIVIAVYIQFVINKINKQNFPNAPKNLWSIPNTIWSILGVIIYIAVFGLSVVFNN